MWTLEVEEKVPILTVTYGEKEISVFLLFLFIKTWTCKITGKWSGNGKLLLEKNILNWKVVCICAYRSLDRKEYSSVEWYNYSCLWETAAMVRFL